jgi:Alpha/beta hydrolase family/Protein of unknown function (DUF3892)
MHETAAVLPAPDEPCTETELPSEFRTPPAWAVDPSNEMRLIPTLRDAAATRNPYEILARSAEAFFRAQNPGASSVPTHEHERLGNALADLAVTGRRSYCLLATPPRTPLHDRLLAEAVGNHIDLQSDPYTPAELLAKVGGLLAPRVSASPTQSDRAVNTALDRAFTTAWVLRGPVAERTEAARTALGWIAVSGEDDMPHRPTNVPAPRFEQYEIEVPVPATGSHSAMYLQTRFIIASPQTQSPSASPHTLRELPPNPGPQVPDGNNVILFLHGHVSGVEEALALIPFIHSAGLARGTRFSIISVDLPNCGYSESFHHEHIARSSATQWPSGPLDREPIRTPILDFIEDFVVAFVDTLDQITPFRDRFSGVIGGSLGGNLGLRLGRRSPMPDWLDKGIVSWNAASVWDPFVNDHVKSVAVKHTWVAWETDESDSSRRDYFNEVYDKDVHEVFVASPQPELWYRKSGWDPCKELHITGSRLARREVYSENLRQWHWRVAGEQLIYSHVDRVDRWDNTSDWRYERNTVRHLLIGCKEDNFTGSNIFDATRTLANLMTATPGTSLFLLETGHSVHFERPRYLAEKIVDFLPSNRTPAQVPTEVLSLEISCVTREHPRSGRIVVVGGTDHTNSRPFSLTVEECIDFIDFGCDVFVTRADGTRTAVRVVRRRGARPYITTAADKSDDNNLLSLPQC